MSLEKLKNQSELLLLKRWHLIILILGAVCTPAVTAVGAYYGIREKILNEKAQLQERVSKIELENSKTYADKVSIEKLDSRIQRIENDITEIKTILRTKLK